MGLHWGYKNVVREKKIIKVQTISMFLELKTKELNLGTCEVTGTKGKHCVLFACGLEEEWQNRGLVSDVQGLGMQATSAALA